MCYYLNVQFQVQRVNGNMPDKCLPTRTMVYVSVKHVFISLTSFMGTPNSMRILNKTSLPLSWRLHTPDVLLHFISIFFSGIWQMRSIRTVVYLLRRNPHWWSPIISPARGANLDSRMLHKISYAWYAFVITTVCFTTLLIDRYNDRLLPLFRNYSAAFTEHSPYRRPWVNSYNKTNEMH